MATDATSLLPGRTGDDVLDWLRTPDARAAAARFVRIRALPGGESLVDDVLAESTLAVLQRMRSRRSLEVDRVGAYGTAVIRSVIRRIVRGREVPVDEAWLEEFAPSSEPQETDDDRLADALRVELETVSAPAVVSAASLAYVTLSAHPDVVPDDAPRPRSGATAEQARCWPALWFAGERGVFPRSDGGDPQRRTRARRIERVLAHLALAVARLRGGGASDG